MVQSQLPVAVPPAPGPARRLGPRAVAVIAVACLVSGGWLVVRPRDVFPDASKIGWAIPTGSADDILIGLPEPARAIHITDVEPVVGGSAVVQVRVLRCRRAQSVLGSVRGADDIDRYCPELDRAEGRLEPFGDDGVGDQLVVLVHPLGAGRVTIDGVRITHAWGPFERTEHTGPDVVVTVGT